MSSRSEVSDSQNTGSSGSSFRDDDRDDVEVVDQMCDATDQMGEEMPVGLGGFEYRGCSRRNRSEEAEGTDQSGKGSDPGEQGSASVARLGSGKGAESHSEKNEEEQGWSANEHLSSMTQQKLDRLRAEYAILNNIILRMPTRDEKPSTPLLGWVTLCAHMLKQGVRLPLSHLYKSG
ncbi:hypothetical protein L3X38_030637 [Prunus dulcis]|uniref:Uncharacterized protein n=1 Tax=Prunus dulcis TaxID=3755 RepID=A0AAD4VBV3_PRUDU|nr:hypothetical protein L3X38_030637 [Prunus dulcis]